MAAHPSSATGARVRAGMTKVKAVARAATAATVPDG